MAERAVELYPPLPAKNIWFDEMDECAVRELNLEATPLYPPRPILIAELG